MRPSNCVRWSLIGAVVVTSAWLVSVPLHGQSIGSRPSGQPPARNPPPQGRLLKLNDGDTLVLDNDERIKVIQRRSGTVRASFNAAERWLILVLDFTAGGAPDGRADWTYSFRNLTGDWPLGERWEGSAVIEDYSVAGQGGSQGVGLRTSQGLLQFLTSQQEPFRDPAASAVLSYRGAGKSSIGGVTFDEAEQRALSDMKSNLERDTQFGPGTSSAFTSFGPGGSPSATATLTGSVSAGGSIPPTKGGPMRVGGVERTPLKIYDVAPVLPERARQAGIRGVVILELTVGVDGSVTDVRVLRSIPMLDEAAIAAVRQWRYDPTLLNGQPVPLVITVPVNFQ